jgi:hypothetical protein
MDALCDFNVKIGVLSLDSAYFLEMINIRSSKQLTWSDPNPRFGSTFGMTLKVFKSSKTEQGAEHPTVCYVYLGCFDLAFGYILMPRRELTNHQRCLLAS